MKKKKKRHVRNRNLFNFLIGRNRNLDKTNWKKNTRKMNYEKRKISISSLFYFIFVFLPFLSYLPNTALSIQLKSNQTNHGFHQMPKHYLHHHTHIPISQLPPYPNAATINGHSRFWDGFPSRPYSVKAVVGLVIVKQICGI